MNGVVQLIILTYLVVPTFVKEQTYQRHQHVATHVKSDDAKRVPYVSCKP
jgi:hypothetical protein